MKVSLAHTSLVNELGKCGETIAVVYELTKRTRGAGVAQLVSARPSVREVPSSTSSLSVELLSRVIDVKYSCFTFFYLYSGETVRRMGTIIQSIFCVQSGAGIRLNFWK